MWMHSSWRKHKQGLSLRGKQFNSMKERKTWSPRLSCLSFKAIPAVSHMLWDRFLDIDHPHSSVPILFCFSTRAGSATVSPGPDGPIEANLQGGVHNIQPPPRGRLQGGDQWHFGIWNLCEKCFETALNRIMFSFPRCPCDELMITVLG